MGVYSEGGVDANGANEVNLRTSAGAELLGQQTSAASLPVVLASNQARIALDAGRIFGFAIEQNQASTGEQTLILLRNPSGSGKTLYITRIAVGTVDSITRFRVRVYQKPTVTGVGTAATIFSNQVKTSPPTSVALAYTLPTTSSFGTRILSFSQADTGMRNETLAGVSVEAGQDILITGDTDASNKVLFANLGWSEE